MASGFGFQTTDGHEVTRMKWDQACSETGRAKFPVSRKLYVLTFATQLEPSRARRVDHADGIAASEDVIRKHKVRWIRRLRCQAGLAGHRLSREK